jgi:predicted phage replisome organizer/uncharacterized phage protein (TIGR02220 family)
MADKKYYWLKLHKDFFKRHEIRVIEEMPNGKDYILFYLKLLVESITHEGKLRFSDAIPYNEQMLSTITNTNIDTVKNAMDIFLQLNMMEILDDATIYMKEVENMVGCESATAQRMRKSRQNKALKDKECNNVTPLLQDCYTDEEHCDIEIRDKSKENRDKNNQDIYIEVIAYLNEKANTNYKWQCKDTQRHINARLNDDFTVDDFKKVVDIKCSDWLGDAKMSKFLRPSTLFGTKFESYLNQRQGNNNDGYDY